MKHLKLVALIITFSLLATSVSAMSIVESKDHNEKQRAIHLESIPMRQHNYEYKDIENHELAKSSIDNNTKNNHFIREYKKQNKSNNYHTKSNNKQDNSSNHHNENEMRHH